MSDPVHFKMTASGVSLPVTIGGTNGKRKVIAFARQERNSPNVSELYFNGDPEPGTEPAGSPQTNAGTFTKIIAAFWDDADLPVEGGEYNITSNANNSSGAGAIEAWYWDDAEQGAPAFADGGLSLASPIQAVMSGLNSGALRIIAAIDSTSSSTNSALTNCSMAANEAIASTTTFMQASAYSLLTDTVGFTSDDQQEAWLAYGIRKYSEAPPIELASSASAEASATGTITKPGLSISDIYQPNADFVVEDATDIDIAVYDDIGGMELASGTANIVGGDIVFSEPGIGSVGDSVFVVARWFVGEDEVTYAATETLVDL